MNLIAITFIALAAALAIFTFMVWRGMSQDWLPIELKTAKLVNVEEDLIVDEPFPVIGRPDQVYRLKNGLHVPLELKNRDQYRIYDTDLAEISLRALFRKNVRRPRHMATWLLTTEKPACVGLSKSNWATIGFANG
jgi:hypothetical protein